jgi:hypothetical protein
MGRGMMMKEKEERMKERKEGAEKGRTSVRALI